MIYVITGWRENGSHATVRRSNLAAAQRCAEAMQRTTFYRVHIFTVRGVQ